ncbi:NADH:flavin oxidoreductase/NADH oxidase protein (plasmid) [Rhizobium etli bv. mimosae str. IE4771]|uniref:NADH:flavin oxidoreductase/NADH oxidase protein n=1 Tax=Rhizobium etli bv. mimosae str. IE4771 TaxID=1432050 RepID=A0A060I7C4_RHIET|nr:NADH-dependent flavin oxidoreductase [Rhizobium sp. IE4771]AIC29782.1 NADH:flavin oxidoreductase/NADH oxidase protein [Rhizobium sp. IE4771]
MKAQLFEPFTFPNGLTLRNHIVMAPMTTWSGNDDGTVSDEEIAYYRRRTQGVGLVLTGCTHVTANGIGFTGEFASYHDKFTPSLRRLADAAKSGGAPAVLQIFHAGNKAEASLVAAEDIVSASSVPVAAGPFNAAGVTPRPLSHDEILDVISAFGAATRRAIEAGFDGIELHGAHGFLLQNFFSPLYNQRDDEWGGSAENRMRFPIAVVVEVKRVIGKYAKRPFLLGYRISPEEPEDGGLRIDAAYELIDRLIETGVDYVHASLSNVLEAKSLGGHDDRTIAELIATRVAGQVPVIAAGQIRTPDQARRALDLGLSLVAVGQGLVINPNWVELSKSGHENRIEDEVKASKVPQIEIPGKLWAVIQAATGWFKIKEDRPEEQQKATA